MVLGDEVADRPCRCNQEEEVEEHAGDIAELPGNEAGDVGDQRQGVGIGRPCRIGVGQRGARKAIVRREEMAVRQPVRQLIPLRGAHAGNDEN